MSCGTSRKLLIYLNSQLIQSLSCPQLQCDITFNRLHLRKKAQRDNLMRQTYRERKISSTICVEPLN